MSGIDKIKSDEMSRSGNVSKDSKPAGTQSVVDKTKATGCSPQKEKRDRMRGEDGDVQEGSRTSGVQSGADKITNQQQTSATSSVQGGAQQCGKCRGSSVQAHKN
jgi:hypothetical protein